MNVDQAVLRDEMAIHFLEEEWAQGLRLNDEWANSLTHGIGFILSLIGFFFLIAVPLENGDYWKLLNFTIYGSSLVLLYLASTLYHFFKKPHLKKLFRKVDHCAIYLLIAGSYTPFTMIPLHGFWGWLLFGLVWGMACLGVIFKAFFIHRFKKISTWIYLGMGWLVIIAIEPLINSVSQEGLYWLFAGGLSYSCGVIFYALDKKRFFHAIWHLFVMGGSLCHYLAIMFHL
ncbi:Hemolysin III [Candidatus Protochlamydia naegleriophila]|uniref:Hemolysin III n=2 Tax=Candidatus Protochlamydia naegleriophila TaxID=389348 RepID=A0A0U5EQN0_9BACT|nr:hemolysin III family protein [Candidatus Protochlamydia naegleriophila]CUI16369.1 Hemolysin III [Candidatus Protochlamydia naegleriophila]